MEIPPIITGVDRARPNSLPASHPPTYGLTERQTDLGEKQSRSRSFVRSFVRKVGRQKSYETRKEIWAAGRSEDQIGGELRRPERAEKARQPAANWNWSSLLSIADQWLSRKRRTRRKKTAARASESGWRAN